MRLGMIGYLVTNSGCENKYPTISESSLELTLQAEENVSLFTPVIGEIPR
jgi:hypothetical protein